jgi:hypothetical protein
VRVGRVIGTASALAVAVPAAGSASATAARPSSTAARPGGTIAKLPASDILRGVAATSARNAWAVGDYANRRTGQRHALIERWNGTRWKVVPSPAVGTFSTLQGVAASRSGAWAVGYFAKSGVSATLIERWTGKAWKRVSSPTVAGKSSQLNSVAIVSRTGAWAVGTYFNGAASQTLTERWNGRRWTLVPSPSVTGRSSLLRAVVTAAPGGAWAVGDSELGGNGLTLAEQWTGTAWQQATSQDFGTSSLFFGAAAFTSANVYAVGADVNGGSGQTLIENWNGSTWTHVPSPNHPSSNDSFLVAAAAVRSAGQAWAVGGYFAGGIGQTLTERLRGGTWTIVASPDVGGATAFNTLFSVTATSAGNAWAVGSYRHGPASLSLVLRWNGHAWKRVPSPNL